VKELVTTLVFLLNGDQVLLAMKKRGHGAGHWNGAGGKVAPGESIEQAMVRECQEEIGVTPLEYHQVAINDFYELHDGVQSKLTAHTFICTKWQGTPIESEEMMPHWFSIDRIPYETMWPDDQHWMPQILAGKKLRTNFRYDDDNHLLFHNVTEVERF